MSSVARPPEPCLVAIVLIVRSRAGPRFVFHYPPNPLSENALGPSSRRGRSKILKNHDSGSSDDSGTISDEDDEGSAGASITRGRQIQSGIEDNAPTSTSSIGGESQRPPSLSSSRLFMKKRTANSDVEDDQNSASHRRGTESTDSAHSPWDTLLGLPSDVWEKFLSPTRTWHKRRFEVCINDLAFVGWPVFIRDDGTWRKRKRRKKSKPRTGWGGGGFGHEEQFANMPGQNDETGKEADDISDTKSGASGDADAGAGAGASKRQSGFLDGDRDSMTMFNVVFVLDPPILEYSLHLREMYENIIKKFSKALKWEQARTDYVWREAQSILQIKEKAKENKISLNSLYSELISNSSLARAIYTLFTSISISKIASVSLDPGASISLQIPPLTSTSYLPSPTDTAYPGLWLTTADSLSPSDDAAASGMDLPNQTLAKHFALLLLDDESTILKDVEASGGALGPALAYYIRRSKPNKSFAQISATSEIPLSNIQLLASHLVYWRRARAIPPLHQRDTYIVSPNCDLRKLSAATAAFAAAFPTLPSLPKMLSALSGTPRPYASFIPSKDHKETYFAILAWLLRGGWVTQLRGFARIKATPEIKVAVEQALQREEMAKLMAANIQTALPSGDGHRNDAVDDASSSPLESRHTDKEIQNLRQSDCHGQYYPMRSSTSRDDYLNTSSLILAPHRASPLESRWLEETMARFPDCPSHGSARRSSASIHGGNGNESEESGIHDSLKKYWPKFTQYFNGHDALEKIAVRENLKRKVVWPLLMRMGLMTGQNLGIESDPRERVLVSVRHW